MSPRCPACILASTVCILCDGVAEWSPGHGQCCLSLWLKPFMSPQLPERAQSLCLGWRRRGRKSWEDGFRESENPNKPRSTEIDHVLVPFASGECVNSPGMWHQFPVGDGKGIALSDPSMHLHGDMSYLGGSKGDGRRSMQPKEQHPQWACLQWAPQPGMTTVAQAPFPHPYAWRGTQPICPLLILPTLSFISPLQFPVSFSEACLSPDSHELHVLWFLVSCVL